MNVRVSNLEILKDGVKAIADRLGAISNSMKDIYTSFFEEELKQVSDEDNEKPVIGNP